MRRLLYKVASGEYSDAHVDSEIRSIRDGVEESYAALGLPPGMAAATHPIFSTSARTIRELAQKTFKLLVCLFHDDVSQCASHHDQCTVNVFQVAPSLFKVHHFKIDLLDSSKFDFKSVRERAPGSKRFWDCWIRDPVGAVISLIFNSDASGEIS